MASRDLALLAGLSLHEAKRRLAELGRGVRERHSGGASSLIVDTDGGGGELVLHYPPSGEPRAWRFPEDPWLSPLAGLARLFSAGGWDPPLEPGLAEAIVGERLMYNPGRRAAFLVRSPASRRLVLKVIRADETGPAVSTLRALAASGLAERVSMPRLVSASASDGALLFEYLPGAPVERWRPAVLDRVAGVLAEVHRLELAGLPVWTPRKDADKLQRLVGLLDASDPVAGESIRPLAARLCDRLARVEGTTTTIHRDFTKRHILAVPGEGSETTLGVLDWDSAATGPPEKDLATLAAGLDAEGVDLLARYERTSSSRLDRRLVNAFVQTQRLTRACRRLLAGEQPLGSPRKTAGRIEAALDDNPFAA